MKNIDKYKEDKVVWHIPHEYSADMKKKSFIVRSSLLIIYDNHSYLIDMIMVQVPLGVELRNENKLDEMTKFLDTMYKYVPSVVRKSNATLPNGDTYEKTDFAAWDTLIGGDQLTVARIRGAISIRAGHDSPVDQLCGFVIKP